MLHFGLLALLVLGTLAILRSAMLPLLVWALSMLTFPTSHARHHDHLILGHPRSPRYAA